MDTSRGRSPSQWLLATVLAAAAALVLPGVAAATSQTFTANGTFTVPAGVTSLAVDVLGAQGGGAEGQIVNPGGRGGEATGTVAVTPGEALTVVVGGTGGHTQRSGPAGRGGANGGGEGGSTAGAGGGGRSEVDRGTTPLVVAGGGGGATPSPEALGGSGGGLTGHGGGSLSSNGGGGGTQTAGGTAGLGIDVSPGSPGTAGVGGAGGSGANGGGGGGGGFFGGGGGGAGSTTVNAGGGGGGSGHLDASVTDGVLTADQHEGGGQVTITYTGDDASVRSSSAPLEQVIGPPTASSSNGSGSSSSSTPASPPAASGLSGLGSPSNAFNFARVRVGVRVLRLGFDYPGRGTLDAIVTTRRPGAESARLRPGPHRVTVGKVHDSADSAQTKTLVIALTRRGKRILAHRGKLPIRVSLVFTPDGGPSARQAHKYTVRPRGRG